MLENSRGAHESGPRLHPRFSWGTTLLVSLVMLLPCVWQSRIQSIDLSSHIYNAWLASLIAQNQAPGLWLAHQANNVLFDLLLAGLLPYFGAAATQQIAVGLAVLVVSWGAILLISHRRPELVVRVAVSRGAIVWVHFPGRLLQFLSWFGNLLLVFGFVFFWPVAETFADYAIAGTGLACPPASGFVGGWLGSLYRCGRARSRTSAAAFGGCCCGGLVGRPFLAQGCLPWRVVD